MRHALLQPQSSGLRLSLHVRAVPPGVICAFVPFPAQILPTAQRLLDELLSSQSTAINTVCGAPGECGEKEGQWEENKLVAQSTAD